MVRRHTPFWVREYVRVLDATASSALAVWAADRLAEPATPVDTPPLPDMPTLCEGADGAWVAHSPTGWETLPFPTFRAALGYALLDAHPTTALHFLSGYLQAAAPKAFEAYLSHIERPREEA